MSEKQQKDTKKGKQVEKVKDFKGTLKRLLTYLKPHKIALLTMLITAVLSTVFAIVSPILMGLATTELFQSMVETGTGVDFDYILNILLSLGVLYLLSVVFSYIQQYIMAGVAQKTVYTIRKEVNEKLTRLPLQYFESRTHGEILSRAVNDLENISSTLQQSITQFITSIVTLIGVVIMMLSISPLMTVIVLLSLPLSFIVTKKVATRSQKYFLGQRKILGQLNGHVEEMYAGHAVIKANNREEQSITTFNMINESLYTTGRKAQFISSVISPLLKFVNNIVYVLICVVGSVLVTKQVIQVGDIQAFIQYIRQFSQPITKVSTIANVIQSTIASAERVFEILDEKEEVVSNNIKEIQSPKGAVRFQRVNFSYQKDKPLIEDMTIDVKQGQTVAIVGPTGAGKTTLINLLMRFYEIDNGKITIDGVDIREVERRNLRSLFGMVLQDTWLFNGTIQANIAYGCKNTTDEEIVRAAKAAHADHFIRTLPDGYDTILNEEASNISAGQKQLLTIARAFISNPTILILDEATSSVDTRTETKIQQAMNTLMKGRTSFVVAHRLSTIRNADMILVMDKGKLIDQGNHNELLAKGGFYADLYTSQFINRNPRREIV
ncbi:ABC transporter ATP-binding protein [Virgibacillus necropolis]|uniref:ABC transporter n=1 Tax=Virgibacillus necropolis TaxID=163877 RepID=A0A221M8S7_9BACI|nr:ABC transporter ATP-binding protein [Virgibacillus necropolis]ASN04058.1 ABC transporter [Virgibacillus necropolis]